MERQGTGTGPGSVWSTPGPHGSARRGWRRVGRAFSTLGLDFFVLKPLAIFVWCFSRAANRVRFPGRRDLLRQVSNALGKGRPVVFASNHVSWFDDPVIPMALYATGQRAFLEILALGGLAIACWLLPAETLPRPVAFALVFAGAVLIALLGARKVWWTLGDLVNLSDASVLRGKLALTRKTQPGPLLRGALRAADVIIPWFMRSDTTKTVFVDRRPGETAKLTRARAIETTLDIAARPEPVWVFFEGGRTRTPGVLAPARRGVGSLILGLRKRGLDPLVVVVYHRGMERLIPPGGSRFLSQGHRVDVRWSVFDSDSAVASARDDQDLAEAVRATAVRLQASTRPGNPRRA